MSSPLKPECCRWAYYGINNGRHFVNQESSAKRRDIIFKHDSSGFHFTPQTNKNIIRLNVQFLEKSPTKLAGISMSPSKSPQALCSLNHHLFR